MRNFILSDIADFKGMPKKLFKWAASSLMTPKEKKKKILQRQWEERHELPIKESTADLTDALSDGSIMNDEMKWRGLNSSRLV